MSGKSATIIENTGNQAHIQTETNDTFIRNNRFTQGEFLNDTGGLADFLCGTVIGRNAADQLVVLDDVSVVGPQYPIGILAQDLLQVGIAGTVDVVNICVSGDVVKDKIIFFNGEVFTDIVEDKTLLDRIGSDSVGIKVVVSTDLTNFDNQ